MDQFLCFVLGVLFATFIMAHWPESTRPYMQGQIDAQNGKIIWHLKKLPDGTTDWGRD